MNTTQFYEFTLLHEIEHIAGAKSEVDATEANQEIVKKCIG